MESIDDSGHSDADSPESSESGEGQTKRRRRRGRRRPRAADESLGMQRLATDDLINVTAEPGPTAGDFDSSDRNEFADPDSLEHELGSEVDADGNRSEGSDSAGGKSDDEEGATRKRRRRRRGKRSSRAKETSASGEKNAESSNADGFSGSEDDDDDNDDLPQMEADDGDDLDSDDDDGDGAPRSRNLHRECTPWKEAIGHIVSANMEARLRNPSSAPSRGRGYRGGNRR
ncbi:MAG: hypothetical protein SGJ20_22125 [Planctomycetota bacterium]|nr:hypothetical protein [Planctomycetota bacterium]